MDKGFNLDLASEYKINEIVFINSGSSHYVRLPVNHHAALLSDNNSGKTSTLSALKLFLLPEENFKDSQHKFNFSSGGKFYSDVDSYQYYFPGSESFIICSAENPRGKFSWILYRTTDLGYERIAVPCSYDDMAHLFWNDDSEKNEGAGQLQSEISITYIKKKLLSKEYGGVYFNKRANIGETIYTRASAVQDNTRFGLLPMAKKFTASSVNTVKALLGIAFSLSDASTTSLPDAIGSIIDGMGLSAVKDDGIILDLENALDEWRILKGTDSHLNKVDGLKNKWAELQTKRDEYFTLKKETKALFEPLVHTLNAENSIKQEQLTELNERADKAEREYNKHSEPYNLAEKTHRQSVSDCDSIQKILEQTIEKRVLAENTREEILPLCPEKDKSDAAILGILDTSKLDLEEELKHLNGEADTNKRLTQLIGEIKNKKKSIVDIGKMLADLEKGTSFLGELTDATASTLLSLNNVFANINPDLNDKEKNTIESFADLFNVDDTGVYLGGKYICSFSKFDSKQVKMSLTQRLVDLKKDLIKDEETQATLSRNTTLSVEQREERRLNCKSRLKILKAQDTALAGIEVVLQIIIEKESELVSAKEKIESASSTLDEVERKHKHLHAEYATRNIELTSFKNELEGLTECIDTLNQIANNSNRLLDYQSALHTQVDNIKSYDKLSVNKTITSLDDVLSQTKTASLATASLLKELLDHDIIDSDPESRYADVMSNTSFETYYSSLDTLFSNLDKQRESYSERLQAHNNTAAMSSTMIENVKGIIEGFIDDINHQLSGYRISNLDNVKLIADLHPQYESMVKALGIISGQNDGLLDKEFYDKISDFQNIFYIRKTGKIDISKIIEKLHYGFDVNGKRETIPQSNGTNSMVNAVLLAILLKKMVPEDLHLTIPVIFDEVGSLDERNLKEVLKVMNDNGLILFAANPESTGVIANVLDTYHDLSIFKATDVEVQGKAESIYFGSMKETLIDIQEAVS